MTEGHTTPPTYLSESDLIGLMETHGIGTDATIAEHIKKVLERAYVEKRQQFFHPTMVGAPQRRQLQWLHSPMPLRSALVQRYWHQ